MFWPLQAWLLHGIATTRPKSVGYKEDTSNAECDRNPLQRFQGTISHPGFRIRYFKLYVISRSLQGKWLYFPSLLFWLKIQGLTPSLRMRQPFLVPAVRWSIIWESVASMHARVCKQILDFLVLEKIWNLKHWQLRYPTQIEGWGTNTWVWCLGWNFIYATASALHCNENFNTDSKKIRDKLQFCQQLATSM